MAKLPDFTSPTVDAIYATYEAKERGSKPRPYLGASALGRECARELWYQFRWCVEPGGFGGRMLRLFDTGHREEARLISELRNIGVELHEVDPQTGKQFSFTDHGGHVGGHMDGAGLGFPEAPKTWHVFEAKTSNAKGFKKLRENGVKKAKPQHFAQCQLYMGWSGMKRAFYMAVSKDTDTLYAERLHFDKDIFEGLRDKARRIVEASEPPTKVSSDPFKYPCGFCDAKYVCHEGQVPRVSCRTCVHATPITTGSQAEHTLYEGGRWGCERHSKLLTREEQEAACDEHLFLPPLVPGKPLDADKGHVLYQIRDKRIANVGATGFAPKDADQLSSPLLREHLNSSFYGEVSS